MTRYSLIARLGAVLVLLSTAWCIGVSWLAGYPELTTFGWGPPIVPYMIISFGLVSLILIIVTFHNSRIHPIFADGMKFGLSIVLLSAATMATTDLWFNTSSILAMQFSMHDLHRSIPSTMSVVGFILLSTLGTLHPTNRWRYVLGGTICIIGMLVVIGIFTKIPHLYYALPGFSVGMSWMNGALFMLSGMCYILMTRHWILVTAAHRVDGKN